MKFSCFSWFGFGLGSLLCSLTWITGLVGQEPEVGAAAALGSIFNVRTAPDAKSMGIFQGNFLDTLRPGSPACQIALVVDVTESMADELPGIREKIPMLLADLQRSTDSPVEVAIVLFADSGSSQKPVDGLEEGFTSDANLLQQRLQAIEPRSGRPYFPEAVDLAVFQAIDKLPWAQTDGGTRWIMLMTDAPPYDASFEEPTTNSRRWYDTDVLVSLANHKGIQIHSLLCQSRAQEQEAFEASVHKTRTFMGQLSSRTGGRMLDLSFREIRQQLAQAAQRPPAEFTYVGAITEDDIAKARQERVEQTGEISTLRIAILPHLPWDDLSFYHEDPAVQFATQLRYSLKRLPGVVAINSRDIEAEFLRLKSGPVEKSQWPQALCLRLKADLLIIGDLRAGPNTADVQSKIYSAQAALPVANIAASGTPEALLPAYLQALQQTQNDQQAPLQMLSRAVGSEQGSDLRQFWPGVMGQLTPQSQSKMLSALDMIEKSLDITLQPQQRLSDLEQAIKLLQSIVSQDEANGFACLLLASAHFNSARTGEELGQLEEGKSHMAKARVYLNRAFDARRDIKDRLLQAEIEADHLLLIRKDIPAAVRRYEMITSFSESSPLRLALRAHWMLAGIQAGDWGASEHPEFQPAPAAAKRHLIQILAFWPDSEEARVIQKYMRWDPSSGRTGTPYFPREGELLLTAK